MDQPTEALIELLDRLRLATPGQVLSQSGHVRRLAGDLPLLDVLWIDALVQAGLLTPFQSIEINAGRGAQLAVGPYVLERPLGSYGFAEAFQGRHLESQAAARVYVLARAYRDKKILLAELDQLVARSARSAITGLVTIDAAGEAGDRLWVASALELQPLRGRRSDERRANRPVRSAADWMIDSGRFPPAVVLHLAQRIVAILAEAEAIGLVHGDLRPASLLCPESGDVSLIHPGLRAIVRPAEGYALADLPPEAYETLAPERVAAGSPPTVASDLYACGCLWWHLLAGRSPLAGGNSLARLQAVHAARIADVRHLAPDTPEALARAIEACLAREPEARPADFAALARMIGPPSRRGAAGLAECLRERKTVRSVLGRSALPPRRRELLPTTHLAAAVLVLAVISGMIWRSDWLLHGGQVRIAAKTTSAGPAASGARPQPRTPLAHALGSDAADHRRGPAVAKAANGAATSEAGPQQGASSVAYWAVDAPPPLVLPPDRTIELDRITLRAGQVVRGADGSRGRVVVSGRPVVLATEGVLFENVDFFLDASAHASPAGTGAMLVVAAARIGFRSCTFEVQATGGAGGNQTTAIAWRGPARSARTAADWQGRLTLDRCAVRGFGLAIEFPAAQRATLDLVDSLVVGCGAVARLSRAPRGEEACEMWLTHFTARETGPLLRIDYEELPAAVGQLTIVAQESTLAPRRGEPLVMLVGPGPVEPLLGSLEWQGQGCLVTPETTIAASQFGEASAQAVADDDLAIAGLVRSPVGFAGESLAVSAQSRAVQWQAALQSSEPPGIDERVP